MLGLDHLRLIKTHVFETPLDSSPLESIQTDIRADAFAQDILDHIVPSHSSCSCATNNRNDYNQFTEKDGLFLKIEHHQYVHGINTQ